LNATALSTTLPLVVLGCPATLLAVLGLSSLINRPLPERVTSRLTGAVMTVAALASLGALAAYWAGGAPRVLSFGAWFAAGHGGFAIDLLADGFSLGFTALATVICGVVAAFSNSYLHREPGYNRYFVLFAAFVTGILLVGLAGSIEVLFAGWELLGLSSALLVAFYHERPMPVRNALRVFAVYRVSDAAMMGAAVLLHHFAGSGSIGMLFGFDAGTEAVALSATQAAIIGGLLVVAVAAKSALLPFSGWLPRAMEGPTPSSAVYYGALSVHAGCFLLLRAAPLLEQSLAVRLMAGSAGAATALYATLAARVQFDVKSALALASLTQVGIIILEIALGLDRIALLHLSGHVCFRLLQFLSAPNVLHDFHELRNAIGAPLAPTGRHLERLFPPRARLWLYRLALEGGYVDAMLDRFVVLPFERLGRRLDGFDRALCNTLAGTRVRQDSEPGGRP
jgi:NADH-quinone oxidoreductase subunit L